MGTAFTIKNFCVIPNLTKFEADGYRDHDMPGWLNKNRADDILEVFQNIAISKELPAPISYVYKKFREEDVVVEKKSFFGDTKKISKEVWSIKVYFYFARELTDVEDEAWNLIFSATLQTYKILAKSMRHW